MPVMETIPQPCFPVSTLIYLLPPLKTTNTGSVYPVRYFSNQDEKS